MTAIVIPTVADVVRSIGDTMDSIIIPALGTPSEHSAGATIRHLLRYVAIRIDAEGQLLLDEVNLLHSVLQDAAAYLESLAGAENRALATELRQTLRAERAANIYPSLLLMASDVGQLRQHVCDVLTALQSLTPEQKGAEGEGLHTRLREYITWQIAQEAKIIEPAFFGHGPRR